MKSTVQVIPFVGALAVLLTQLTGCVTQNDLQGSVPHNTRVVTVDECKNDESCDGLTTHCVGEPGARTCVRAVGYDDGDRCRKDADCAGGKCILDPDWTEGFCTTLNCRVAKDCSTQKPESTACVNQISGANMCMRTCGGDSDCRYGYFCKKQSISDAKGICYPDLNSSIDLGFADGKCQRVKKGTLNTYTFTLPNDVESYFLTMWTKKPTNILYPVQLISTPDVLDYFYSGNHTQKNQMSSLNYRDIATFQMPLNKKQLRFVKPGTSTISYSVRYDGDVCARLTTKLKSKPTKTVDLNIYLVGVNDVTADNAASYAPLIKAINKFKAIYKSNGLELGEIKYIDPPKWVIDRFSVLREPKTGFIFDPIYDLVRSHAAWAPEDKNNDYAVSIYLVKSLNIGGFLGFSPGLPGVAGFNGTKGSGVVVSSDILSTPSYKDVQANGKQVHGGEVIGQVMAHETGHYLGLFHTTETDLNSFDDISDTPQCSEDKYYHTDFSTGCEDHFNLMFPFASSVSVTLTPTQVMVMKANPSVK